MAFVRRLIWDPGNVGHIARHQVRPEAVEQVCQGQHIQGTAYAGRIMLIGLTEQGRCLSVVLAPEGEQQTYYVVTARSASRKERQFYQHLKGDESP